ncbi:MAG: penicillin acylase family protein [Myxococcota bacterium]
MDAQQHHDIGSMQSIQLDVFSLQAQRLLPRFLSLMPEARPEIGLGLGSNYDASNVEASIFHQMYRGVINALAEDTVGGGGGLYYSALKHRFGGVML